MDRMNELFLQLSVEQRFVFLGFFGVCFGVLLLFLLLGTEDESLSREERDERRRIERRKMERRRAITFESSFPSNRRFCGGR
jgi:hypothetical protein